MAPGERSQGARRTNGAPDRGRQRGTRWSVALGRSQSDRVREHAIPRAERLRELGADRKACRQIRAWREAGHQVVPISVNISPRQLRVPGYEIDVANALHAENLSPCDLRLELTETAVLDEGPVTLATLTELRQMGVGLVLDDFGTGFSSLSNLARLPITGLKIDRTFVARALDDERAAAVVSCLADLARRLGLSVTAEGVESTLQLL